MRRFVAILTILLLAFAFATSATAQEKKKEATVRIKDIARILGVRDNQLRSVGLIVGLSGTGDSASSPTVNTLRNVMRNMGIDAPDQKLNTRNVALVMLTATLPPFARVGDKIDVKVASIGDAKSLQGGVLIQTELKAANGVTYAVAQGSVSLGGFGAGGVTRGALTVGRIPNGANVEREVKTNFIQDVGGAPAVTVVLNEPDFTTAARAVKAINDQVGQGVPISKALDAGSILVQVSPAYVGNEIEYISLIEAVKVSPDVEARIVINERTGTIVMGENVAISSVAVAHGTLTVTISKATTIGEEQEKAPPGPTIAERVVTEEITTVVQEPRVNVMVLPASTTVKDVVEALNAVGATANDIIAILQAMKEAGALHGKLEII
ncbi:MAG: flagellar basal body P-ring protein FlgI [bacterium]